MSPIKTQQITNREVSQLLREVAAAQLIKNSNRFQIIAYENAADSIEHLNREVKDIWQEGKLSSIPHVGATIAEALDEYFKKGHSKHFERIFEGIPSTVFDLMNVPTLGPKKAMKLVEAFKLINKKTIFEDLKRVAEEGKIETLPNFGKKSQDAILQALDLHKKQKANHANYRMPLPYAGALAEEVESFMKELKEVKRTDTLGSLRRSVTTIGDVDIAVVASEKATKKVIEHFIQFPRKSSVINAGAMKSSIMASPGIRVDLRVQEKDNYGPMLQYFTGSKAHNVRLREYALKKGLSLSEHGIKIVETGKILKFATEEEFYKYLGMQYIPPEIREGTNEIEIALRHEIPTLVETSDMKGDMHLHSSYDLKPSHDLGENSYKEILKKAEELKYEYIGFSDHNPKQSGLTLDQITAIMKKRKEHIQKVCARSKVKYFIGLETDILPDGSLALPETAFAYVDYLLISVHSVFRLDIKTMTERVLKGLSHPKVKILAHPTGRLIGKREGYELQWEKIFEFCAKKKIAIEINAWPERLDLPDTLVREALTYGVKFSIDTDAHANFHMDNMKYGVAVARRGWAKKNDIMNTAEKSTFEKWLLSD